MTNTLQATRDWKAWSFSNPVVVATALSLLVAGLRLMQVSRADPEVLRTLIQTLDVTTIVLATVLPIMPSLVLLGTLEAIDWYRQTPKESRKPLPEWFILIPILLIGTVALYTPILLLSTYILTYLAFMVKRYRSKKKGNHSHTRISFVGGAAVIIIITLFNGGTMWLPQENLHIEGQPQKSVYVLTSDVRWTTMLVNRGTVQVVPTSTVTDRQPCTTPTPLVFRTISTARTFDSTRLPECLNNRSVTNNEKQENSMNTGAPWWAFIVAAILSAIAIIVSIFSLWYSGEKSSERDIENWRRTTLATKVSDIISDAETMIRNDLNVDDTAQMETYYDKLAALDRHLTLVRVCDKPVSEKSDSYIELAKQYKNKLSSNDVGDEHNEQLKKNGEELTAARSSLVTELANSIRLKQAKTLNAETPHASNSAS